MKTFRKCTALLLSAVLLLSLLAVLSVLPAVAAEDDIIEIGGTSEGPYANITNYIAKYPDYEGKTFRLVKNITEGKTNLTKSCTIDGNGYTVTSGEGINVHYMVDGSDSATADNNLKVEFKNIHFTADGSRSDLISVFVKGHAEVTLTNCHTDTSINRVVAMRYTGDCHLTVESGVYWANNVFLKHDFTVENSNTIQNTVDIKGGFFGLAGTANITAIDPKTCLFNATGSLALNITGGVFYSPVKAPLVYQKYVGKTAPAPTINVTGGTFYLPEEQTLLFGREKQAASYPAPTVTIENAAFLRTLKQTEEIPTAIDASASENFTPENLSFTTETNARLTLNGQTFAGLVDKNLDVAASMIDLTADCTATAAFEETPVFKNGYRADGLTGNAVVKNFGEEVYVQYHTNSDGTYDARIILAFTDENCTAAEWTITNPENGKSETVPVTVCYRAFRAADNTVTAEECGGTRVLIVSVDGLTEAQDGKQLTVCATLTTDEVSHTSRSFTFTIEKPAA
ncbi:MAG TPA: hypothetical protein DDW30_05530 [Clostridiales bacterium]|nr:hypothetical protein [Clostridiales bacterium]